jgi:hypothetical protein
MVCGDGAFGRELGLDEVMRWGLYDVFRAPKRRERCYRDCFVLFDNASTLTSNVKLPGREKINCCYSSHLSHGILF